MGDIGDYWREKRDHDWRKKHGIKKTNVSLKTKTVQCTCGKWLVDEQGHADHAKVKGKKTHKIAKIDKPLLTWDLQI